MDIDLDWCLTCEKRVDGSSPYCSTECQNIAGPSNYSHPQVFCDDDSDFSSEDEDVIFHPIDDAVYGARWIGNGSAGIHAWAAEIPAGAPAGGISSPCDDSSSQHFFSLSTLRPQLPQLLKSSCRVVPPTLSMATPRPPPAPLSTPMLTPHRQSSVQSLAQTSQDASMSKTSLKSAATESSLATPASSHPMLIASASRKPSMLGEMYTQVRSWVSPSPAIFVPAQYQQQRHQPPVFQLDSIDFMPIHTELGSVALDKHHYEQQQQLSKQSHHRYETPRGRSRLVPELAPLPRDEHPSFRTRGRRASRAAA